MKPHKVLSKDTMVWPSSTNYRGKRYHETRRATNSIREAFQEAHELAGYYPYGKKRIMKQTHKTIVVAVPEKIGISPRKPKYKYQVYRRRL